MSGNPHLNDADKASTGPLGPPVRPAAPLSADPQWHQSDVHPGYLRRVRADGMIEVIGQWPDDRVGIYRENKSGKYTGTAMGEKGDSPVGSYDGYEPLLFEVLKFAVSGQPPVSEAETLEIYAFMEAADESKRQNGASVTLESVMKKARAEAAEKVQALK